MLDTLSHEWAPTYDVLLCIATDGSDKFTFNGEDFSKQNIEQRYYAISIKLRKWLERATAFGVVVNSSDNSQNNPINFKLQQITLPKCMGYG